MINNDNNLKDMWNKTANLMGTSDYESSTIAKFLSRKSIDTSQKIKNMIIFDIILKTILVVLFGINIILYSDTFNIVSICSIAILLLIFSILYLNKMFKRFKMVTDHSQNTRENLTAMLAYLKSRFYTTLIAISATYIFIFIAGSLIYFYVTYGMVRPLDGIDIVVFLAFIFMGIGFNFFTNKAQINYQIKHLELCLSDLNDNVMIYALENIEMHRKQDRINKLLIMLFGVVGLLLLIAVLMNAFGH